MNVLKPWQAVDSTAASTVSKVVKIVVGCSKCHVLFMDMCHEFSKLDNFVTRRQFKEHTSWFGTASTIVAFDIVGAGVIHHFPSVKTRIGWHFVMLNNNVLASSGCKLVNEFIILVIYFRYQWLHPARSPNIV